MWLVVTYTSSSTARLLHKLISIPVVRAEEGQERRSSSLLFDPDRPISYMCAFGPEESINGLTWLKGGEENDGSNYYSDRIYALFRSRTLVWYGLHGTLLFRHAKLFSQARDIRERERERKGQKP